jgi:creatinine amidohydrolase
MRITEMNWMQVEAYLKHDDRAVVPLGSIEQHGYLSLGVDAILAERMSVEAAEPLGVPVFPTLSYGITPYFKAYPGTISLRIDTLLALVRDVFDGLAAQGFRRIVMVNGHGGNSPVQSFVTEWLAEHPTMSIKFHNWWNAPRTWALVNATDPIASHASWMENFPWTRLGNVVLPPEQKPMVAVDRIRRSTPTQVRAMLGDGNYGGYYQRPDEEMLAIWRIAVEETRTLIDDDWSMETQP